METLSNTSILYRIWMKRQWPLHPCANWSRPQQSDNGGDTALTTQTEGAENGWSQRFLNSKFRFAQAP
ncbi:hypothetical protein E4U31_005614 [Claviceps sp. LM219 group G6]|nr:hypothetical protein E4U31_005614 [Claviceps sp. LM219 group G6]